VHDLALARKYADRVLLLHHGQCAALGTPASVFTRDRLQEIYGMDVHAWMQALYAQWEEPDPEL
jgi:iron complex transport system ATP-binding protein